MTLEPFYLYILGLAITLAVGLYYAQRWEDPNNNSANSRMKRALKDFHDQSKFPRER